MEQNMFTVRFSLRTTKGFQVCRSTVFAESFDGASDQVKQVFGCHKEFEIHEVECIGKPIIMDAKELKQIN